MRRPAILRALGEMYDSADRHDVAHAASAMAFDMFLGLMPLLAMLGWLAGFLARRGPSFVDLHVLDVAPLPAAKIAREQFMRLEAQGESLAPYAVIGFFWLASGSAHVALSTVRKILGLPDRSWFRTRLIAFAVTIGALAMMLSSSIAIVYVVRLRALGLASVLRGQVWNDVVALLTVGGLLVSVAAIYRVAGGRMARGARVWPGAVVAVLLFGGVSALFSFYVARLARYVAFYGALASVAILLIWLWLSSLALLVGAELNAYLTAARRTRDSALEVVD